MRRVAPRRALRSARPPDAGGTAPVGTAPGPGLPRRAAPRQVNSEPVPLADTLSFRLERIPIALADLEQSPIIGLGAASFAQRHDRADMKAQRDYLAILAVVTLYESGIVGAAALTLALLLVLWQLFGISRHQAGLAGAFAGSIVSLLVAYQSTNALFFSINWLIIGAALAFVVRTRKAWSGGGMRPIVIDAGTHNSGDA